MKPLRNRWAFARPGVAFGLALCCNPCIDTSLAQQEPVWLQQAPITLPAERMSHGLSYNPIRGSVMMFGGLGATNAALGDTWEWVGFNPASPAPPYRGTWTQRSTGPSSRYGHAMVWDAARGVVTLFGGRSTTTQNNETWVLSGTTWTQRSPAVRPAARSYHAMAYDAERQRIVLFGGTDGTNMLADTHEFDGTNWAPRFPATFPAPRAQHAMTYDPVHHRVLLFGGRNAPMNVTFDSTWTYDGTTWVQSRPAIAPPARYDAGLTFDTWRGVAVLFGGTPANQADDTWEWNGATWVQRQPQIPRPQPRRAPVAFDINRGRTVLFGGELVGGVKVNDVWEYFFQSGYITFGEGCVGSIGVPGLLCEGTVPARLGGTVQLRVTNVVAGSPVFVITGLSDRWWGTTPLPVDLAFQGMPGCSLYVSVDATDLVIASSGGATRTIALPSNPSFLGFVFYNQALVLDPGAGNPLGGTVTNAGKAVIGN